MSYHRESIKNILAEAFPKTFREHRFPFGYHHEYAAEYDFKYQQYQELSRLSIAELLDSFCPGDAFEYELMQYATLHLIRKNPNEFQKAIASTDDSFWHLLDSLRTLDSFRVRWLCSPSPLRSE